MRLLSIDFFGLFGLVEGLDMCIHCDICSTISSACLPLRSFQPQMLAAKLVERTQCFIRNPLAEYVQADGTDIAKHGDNGVQMLIN